MASLKEIKGRIGSVESTLKITSAMKMVASAKLHKAQQAIESMLPYNRRLTGIMQSLISGGAEVASPLSRPHGAVRHVALVAIASNSSLCGGYNANMVRLAAATLRQHLDAGAQVTLYVIGRKLDQALQKLQKGKGALPFTLVRDYVELGDNPRYDTARDLAQRLMADYEALRIDAAELLYMHFRSTASQVPTRQPFLPLQLDATPAAGCTKDAAAGAKDAHTAGGKNVTTGTAARTTSAGGTASASRTASAGGTTHSEVRYIIEPSPAEVVAALIPDALRMKVYTAMLDAQAAEHAARTVAMQTATDNANELLDELRLAYNKGRQAAITAELLDIVGGSMQ